MMNKKMYIMLVFIFFILLTGCKKVDTVIDVQPVKDPRNYTWTADTLGYPGSYQTLMTGIWGSSPSDVYAVGHTSFAGNGVMWHFDGNKWTNTNLLVSEGGQISGSIELSSVYGFSRTDIYAVGKRIRLNPNPPPNYSNYIDSSLIIHYDGSTWRQFNIYNGRLIADIYGTSSSDIWAGGWENKMYHFNGSKWETDSIKISIPADYFFQVGSVSSYKGDFYVLANSNDNKGHSIFYLIKKENNNWAVQDSFYAGGWSFGTVLNRSKTESFFSVGNGGVYKYNGSSWDNIFYITSTFIGGIWGTSDENIFVISNGGGGRVYHYNGIDWKEIEQLSNTQAEYFAVWTDGTEAFVVGHIFDAPSQKTIVWHGK